MESPTAIAVFSDVPELNAKLSVQLFAVLAVFANDFNKIVSLVKKTKPTDEDLKESKKNIQYHIYDLPNVDDTFKVRYSTLCSLRLPKECIVVKTHIVKSEDMVMERYGEYVEAGYEGQMLRIDGKYENKRSKNL